MEIGYFTKIFSELRMEIKHGKVSLFCVRGTPIDFTFQSVYDYIYHVEIKYFDAQEFHTSLNIKINLMETE